MARSALHPSALVPSVIVLSLLVAPAGAGPDPGSVSGSTATFTGNQFKGIRTGVDFACPPVENLYIANVTSLIRPVVILLPPNQPAEESWSPGVEITHHGADGANGGVWESGGHGHLGRNLGITYLVGYDFNPFFIPYLETGQDSSGEGGNFGIGAMSFGGDGGNGGAAYLFGEAGNGGWGRPGGDVHIYAENGRASYDIVTRCVDGPAVLARSEGGEGGNGGDAGGIYVVGGSAGAGGDGGAVSVDCRLGIWTEGANAHGIQAQSFGGATGVPGDAGGIVIGGGDSGSSGRGGPVTVTAIGAEIIRTRGADAHGILAQSVGGFARGAGGAGGLVAWGGSSASTGSGGTVLIDNGDWIIAEGPGSSAIVGQSIGGGGGSATQGGGIVTFGGRGNASGHGNPVDITNRGNLNTYGASAPAVLGQSIGGGGGRGGGVIAIVPIAGISYGGAAGPGGNGGAVDIECLGGAVIRTAGAFSHGLQGQSVGGGGASGGNIYSGAVGVGATAGFSFGGTGGSGGHGGPVTLTPHGSDIATTGDFAHGQFAQSIGGGGGSGGNIYAVSTTVGIVQGMDLSVRFGGAGGRGGDGAAVTLGPPSAPAGAIETAGHFACASVAQSIGGGGGAGGNSYNASVRIDTVAATADVGGSGGDGGAGGAVTVRNHDRLATQGACGHGILAQSIGGGGGAGGNAVSLAVDLPGLEGLASLVAAGLIPNIDGSLTLGGRGGVGGSGGTVDVSSAGAIATQNVFAHGILAQSIGGGGGAGGNVVDLDVSLIPNLADTLAYAGIINPADVSLTIGGSGGVAGDGAPVSVHNGSAVSTHGPFATAILAQSVGGGGGSGGLAIEDLPGLINLVAHGPALRTSAGSGSGSTVTVTNSAAITTYGPFAHGILAQSTGGGGGVAGIREQGGVSELTLLSSSIGYLMASRLGIGVGFVGSAGGFGAADDVEVNHTGSIDTWGDVSHGVFAQSAGGSGAGGPVRVTLGSEITARGADAHAIFAQSIGRGGGSNIVVTVLGGAVQGGSGSGAGVCFDGGDENLLTNAGHIHALSGCAVVGGAGNETIDNHGVITGDVGLGAGRNAFHNLPGATFNMGALVQIGVGALVNQGVLSPGGPGAIAATTIVGDLAQGTGGVLEIDLGGLDEGAFDCIRVTGALCGPDDGTALPMAGQIRFRLMPGVVLASLIEPLASGEFAFLKADTPGLAPAAGYDFSACPAGFAYEVIETAGGTLSLRATNLVPEPTALALLVAAAACRAGPRARRPTIAPGRP